jgi:hypothetical protein
MNPCEGCLHHGRLYVYHACYYIHQLDRMLRIITGIARMLNCDVFLITSWSKHDLAFDKLYLLSIDTSARFLRLSSLSAHMPSKSSSSASTSPSAISFANSLSRSRALVASAIS